MTVPLRTNQIPYLDPDILEEYSTISLVSKDGKTVKVNHLIFISMCTINLLDYTDDEHLIITEMSTQELIDAKAFCHTGINDRANPNVLKALGINIDNPIPMTFPNFTEKLEVKLEPEPEIGTVNHHGGNQNHDHHNNLDSDNLLEHLDDIMGDVINDEDLDEEMEDMEDSKSDLDFKPPTNTSSKKNKSVKKSLRSSNNSTSLSNKRNGRDANTSYDPINSRRELTDDEKVDFDQFETPKPIEEYKAPPQKLNRPGNITKHFDNSVECKKCGQCLSGKRNLKKHDIKYHQDHYNCAYCDLAFSLSDTDLFRLHLFKHLFVLNNVNACVQCGKQWKTPHLLRKHQAQKGPYHNEFCAQCSTQMRSYQEYEKHVEEQHYGTWKFKCGHCELIYDSVEDEENHVKVMHKAKRKARERKAPKPPSQPVNKERVCNECGAIVANLSNHMQLVHDHRSVVCPHCGKLKRNEAVLKSHVKSVHEKRPCLICGQMVPIGKMEFHVHQNHTSHEDRKHRCHLCGKGFIYPHKLQEHLNTHTGEKPFKCKFCNAAFASSSNKRMHERAHLGIKVKQTKK